MPLPSPSPDSRALITGASQGIGMAIARDLAKQGHHVILVARRKDVLEQFATELTSRYNVTAEVFPCDLSDEQQRHKLIADIKDRDISIIINSAGIASFGPFMDQEWEYETNQFELNATAVFELTRAVLPRMLANRKGAILNNATYVFTKAGVNVFTEALHYELKGSGVSCTLLAPGPVRDAVIPEEEKSIVDKVVPDFLWTTYESCAKESLEALAKNKRRVVPGPLSKVLNVASLVAPRGIASPLIGSFYKKMS